MSATTRRNIKRATLILLFLIGVASAFIFIYYYSVNFLYILIVFGIIVKIFPRIILGSREERVIRYFSRKPNVRIQLVEEVVSRAEPVQEKMEHLEIVAIFSILISKYNVSQTIQHMTNYSYRGWDKYFNDIFFSLILATSQEFRRLGLYQDHKEILQFAEAVARQHNNEDWANTFKNKREEIMERQKDNIPIIRWPR